MSTSPLCGEITATTLLENSKALPPSYATKSGSSPTPQTPRSFSKAVVVNVYAWRRSICSWDTSAAYGKELAYGFSSTRKSRTHAMSKRVFLANSPSRTPNPTVTPCRRRTAKVVSFVSGGPGNLCRILLVESYPYVDGYIHSSIVPSRRIWS